MVVHIGEKKKLNNELIKEILMFVEELDMDYLNIEED